MFVGMKRLMRMPRRFARRMRLAVEVAAAVAFVVEALLERFGDPGLGFVA
jgi:hypothetical protein